MGLLSGLNGTRVDGIPLPRFVLRLVWAAFEVLAVIYFATHGGKFFYQGF
jgi:hypothetical protein